MAYEFDVVGWEDRAGDRHLGKPSDVGETFGQLVHVYDPDTGEHHHFWAFVGGAFQDWDDWLDYIESMIEMYNQYW